MTVQKAIKVLEVFTTEKFQCLTSSEFDDAICCAIEALEKQDAKKPLFGTVHNDTAYYCSSCKNFIGFYDTRIYEYCHNCGQKLDWGD